MPSNFTVGFQKTAFVGETTKAVGKAVVKPLAWAGKTAIRLGGGPLNAALNAVDAASTYSRGMNKMRAAGAR